MKNRVKCANCGHLCIVQYLDKQLKGDFVCLSCKQPFSWSRTVYFYSGSPIPYLQIWTISCNEDRIIGRNLKEFEKMTGFEKWLFYFRDKNGKWLTPTLAKFRTNKEEEAAKEGWIGALKWVLDLDSDFCQCGCLEEQIGEELNEN